MNSLKEKERMKDGGNGFARWKRIGDDDEMEAAKNEDMVGPDDDSCGLVDVTLPLGAKTVDLENLGKIPKSRMFAGRGAKSGTWREPRSKKIKMFKQIKGQGMINWISGWVPGESENEGGDQTFKRQPQKPEVS